MSFMIETLNRLVIDVCGPDHIRYSDCNDEAKLMIFLHGCMYQA